MDFSRYPKDGVELENLSDDDRKKIIKYEELREGAHYGENYSGDIYDRSAIFTRF